MIWPLVMQAEGNLYLRVRIRSLPMPFCHLEASLVGWYCSRYFSGKLTSSSHWGYPEISITSYCYLSDSPLLPAPAINFPLTNYVHGPGGTQDLILRAKGSVLLDTGGSRRTAAIDANGQAIFSEIPANFRGREVPVGLDAEGYELADPQNNIRLNASSAYLEVRKKSGHIVGYVRDESGAPLAGVSIAVAGITESTKPDGSFELTIPGEWLKSELTLRAVAPRFAVWSDTVVPDSNEVAITLVRKR